jgi:hypothetical protein
MRDCTGYSIYGCTEGEMRESIHELRISKNIEELRLQLDLLEEIIIDIDRKLDDIIAPRAPAPGVMDAILREEAHHTAMAIEADNEHEKHEKDKRLRILDKACGGSCSPTGG